MREFASVGFIMMYLKRDHMIREDCFAGSEPCADLIRALTAAELRPFNMQATVNIQPKIHKP